MGRLKNFGKSSKRPASGDATVTAPIVEDKDAANTSGKEGEGVTNSLRSQHLRALNAILTQPLTPPLSLEAPPVSLPSSVAVTISEESTDDMGGGTWTDVYNSVASQTEDDLEALEMAAPIWLLELLLLNRFIGGQVLAKVSFVVVAYESRGEAIADSSRLTAGRILRVRKVLQYVRDKLEPIDNARNLTSKPASALAVACDPKDARAQPPQAAASSGAPPVPEEAKLEDTYELLCNEMALPVTMTIGAVRHYVWRQGGELTMYYRRKPSPAPATSINDATPAVSSQGNLHKEL
ncbi:hypothetical protein FRB99_002587 [Tulasnella sp. 403]|nr:hypothetical protein FRB99_002587 [Tulasnella sp. 403]